MNIEPTIEEKGGMGEKETWKNSYEIYLDQATEAFNELIENKSFIDERQKYHPNLDIKLSMEKAFNDFWRTAAGWKNKKISKSKNIDWEQTFKKALDQKFNHVYQYDNKNRRNNEESGLSEELTRNVLEGYARAEFEKQQR